MSYMTGINYNMGKSQTGILVSYAKWVKWDGYITLWKLLLEDV